MFTAERLILRPYRESDLDEILAMWNEPSVQTGASIDHVVPRTPKFKDTIRGWLDNCRFHIVIELKSTGEFVGYVTLRDENAKNRDGDLAITLSARHWGKGYGKEVLKFVVDYAFRSLNLHRVSLGVFESNERALHLYKSIGFVQEGRIRKATWIEGAWRDVVSMGILDEEWAARQQVQ